MFTQIIIDCRSDSFDKKLCEILITNKFIQKFKKSDF